MLRVFKEWCNGLTSHDELILERTRFMDFVAQLDFCTMEQEDIDKLDSNRVAKIMTILNSKNFGQIFITDTSFDRVNSIMQLIDSSCKYFLYKFDGTYDEKIKNEKVK